MIAIAAGVGFALLIAVLVARDFARFVSDRNREAYFIDVDERRD